MKRVLTIGALLLAAVSAMAQEITVAAAADLNLALKELAQQYEAKSGAKVKLTFGSSGNFFAAIQNGAPFDVYFSADVDYPRRLEAAGLTEPGTMFEYAVGRLVLWAPKGSPVDVRQGLKVLADGRVRKIAIANPQHAPYGRAAVEAMKAAGVYEQAKSKFVLGENISQAFQFVQTGNADVGVIAMSLVSHPSRIGQGGAPEPPHPSNAGQDGAPERQYWLVPEGSYPAIRQAAVVVKSSRRKEAAKRFLEYVKSEEAKEILRQYGFERPQKN